MSSGRAKCTSNGIWVILLIWDTDFNFVVKSTSITKGSINTRGGRREGEGYCATVYQHKLTERVFQP